MKNNFWLAKNHTVACMKRAAVDESILCLDRAEGTDAGTLRGTLQAIEDVLAALGAPKELRQDIVLLCRGIWDENPLQDSDYAEIRRIREKLLAYANSINID